MLSAMSLEVAGRLSFKLTFTAEGLAEDFKALLAPEIGNLSALRESLLPTASPEPLKSFEA